MKSLRKLMEVKMNPTEVFEAVIGKWEGQRVWRWWWGSEGDIFAELKFLVEFDIDPEGVLSQMEEMMKEE